MKFLQLEEENIEELAALDTLDAGELFELESNLYHHGNIRY